VDDVSDDSDALPPAAGSAPAARPAAWPAALPDPPEVADALAVWRAARTAWARHRHGLEAELVLAPQVDLRARDDPPRPLESEARLRPSASLRWSPLRSETLLAEARVLEADAAWIAAWREALLARWTLPVERDRAAAAHRWAEERRRAAAAAEDGAEDGAAAREAALDLREARLDLADAARELRAIDARAHALGLAAAGGPADRPALALPEIPDPVATRAYRARAARLAADVARSERRWADATMPLLSVEAGYAGSDASVEAGLALRHGRPAAKLDATLAGTPQERAWARLQATFRLGSDLGEVRAEREAARSAEVEELAAFEARWRAELAEARRDADAATERWRLAEERLAAVGPDDRRGRERALDAAQRAWLRMARDHGALLAWLEAWPERVPDAA
jgi:hypothetical protein